MSGVTQQNMKKAILEHYLKKSVLSIVKEIKNKISIEIV